MSIKLKAFVTADNKSLESFFSQGEYETVNNISDCDFVVFGGGPDIHPRLYYQTKLPDTSTNNERDKADVVTYLNATANRKVCVGICRGAQLLWALNNGDLYQDVDNHLEPHQATVVVDGKETKDSFWVSSTHHQMIVTSHTSISSDILLVSDETTMRSSGPSVLHAHPTTKATYIHRKPGQTVVPARKDVEAYFIPKTDCFGVQFHPEYQGKNDPALEWFNKTLSNLLWTGVAY